MIKKESADIASLPATGSAITVVKEGPTESKKDKMPAEDKKILDSSSMLPS